jgi:hypothetical protein
MAARLSRSSSGVRTGSRPESTVKPLAIWQASSSPFTLVRLRAHELEDGTRTRVGWICQAHCSVLRVRALGREPPGLLLKGRGLVFADGP